MYTLDHGLRVRKVRFQSVSDIDKSIIYIYIYTCVYVHIYIYMFVVRMLMPTIYQTGWLCLSGFIAEPLDCRVKPPLPSGKPT